MASSNFPGLAEVSECPNLTPLVPDMLSGGKTDLVYGDSLSPAVTQTQEVVHCVGELPCDNAVLATIGGVTDSGQQVDVFGVIPRQCLVVVGNRQWLAVRLRGTDRDLGMRWMHGEKGC